MNIIYYHLSLPSWIPLLIMELFLEPYLWNPPCIIIIIIMAPNRSWLKDLGGGGIFCIIEVESPPPSLSCPPPNPRPFTSTSVILVMRGEASSGNMGIPNSNSECQLPLGTHYTIAKNRHIAIRTRHGMVHMHRPCSSSHHYFTHHSPKDSGLFM